MLDNSIKKIWCTSCALSDPVLFSTVVALRLKQIFWFKVSTCSVQQKHFNLENVSYCGNESWTSVFEFDTHLYKVMEKCNVNHMSYCYCMTVIAISLLFHFRSHIVATGIIRKHLYCWKIVQWRQNVAFFIDTCCMYMYFKGLSHLHAKCSACPVFCFYLMRSHTCVPLPFSLM